MKRLLFTLLLLITVMPMVADVNDTEENKEPETKQRFYIMPLISLTHSMNENSDVAQEHNVGFGSHTLSWGGSLTIGKDWNRYFGWRLQAGIDKNKSRSTFWNTQDISYSFLDAELFGDLTFNVSNLFLDDYSDALWKYYFYAGIGYLQTFDFSDKVLNHHNVEYSTASKGFPGVRAGLNVSRKVSKNVALALDYCTTFMPDKFNGVKNGIPVDVRMNFSVGVIYYLQKKPMPVVVEEVIEEEINDVAYDEIEEIIIPKLVLIEPADETVKIRMKNFRSYVSFPVNKTEIYPEYMNNPAELQRIKQSIDTIHNNPTVSIQKIELHGYASPESPYKHNAKLSLGRVISLKGYLNDYFKFDDSVFQTSNTPEDWEGLRQWVVENEIEFKEEILKVIDSDVDPDIKNDRMLRRINNGKTYKFLLNNVYPYLRHTDYTVTYQVRNYNLDEAKEIINQNPDLLSLHEMYLVAMSYPKESAEYANAINVAYQSFPNNPVAMFNKIALEIQKENYNEAKAIYDSMPEGVEKDKAYEAVKFFVTVQF